ncbi:MAG: hypothetical protein O3C57_01070 [Verrucomicrobia bacterium]|nr:hypothetical protein [Verrucomicrobiota bacterium]
MSFVWLSCSAVAANDAASSPALGAKVGTLGGSAEATIPLRPTLNLRGVYNYLDFSTDRTVDDVKYEVDISFESYGGYLDWHPLQNNFRISAGVLANQNEILLDARPKSATKIGDTTYPAVLLGSLSGELEFEKFSPYFGIGFGNAATSTGHWSFSFDLGVLFQSYDVNLSATGPANAIPGFSEDLAAEEADIQKDLDDIELYPVIAFGMAYRF